MVAEAVAGLVLIERSRGSAWWLRCRRAFRRLRMGEGLGSAAEQGMVRGVVMVRAMVHGQLGRHPGEREVGLVRDRAWMCCRRSIGEKCLIVGQGLPLEVEAAVLAIGGHLQQPQTLCSVRDRSL